jgi:2-methylisocitrate lyase-like PEP mutase family enzyme
MSNGMPQSAKVLTVDTARLGALARRLLDLHRPGNPLVLINAWDVASAKSVESAGAAAVATSSAAIAQANGVQDDNTAGELAFESLRAIADHVTVPVTADLEGGYGLSGPDLVEALLNAGAVGCNIEDTDHVTGNRLLDADEHASYLAEIRSAATSAGVAVVINARIDTIIQHPRRDASEVLTETVRRARMYMAAGADCVYPIGLNDPAIVKELVDTLGTPVNANPSPALSALAAAGAARISTGAGTYRLMLADLERSAKLMFAAASSSGALGGSE